MPLRMWAIRYSSLLCLASVASSANEKPGKPLTVERIYGKREFIAKTFSARWLPDGKRCVRMEKSQDVSGGRDIVAIDAKSGRKEVLASALALVPPGENKPLSVEACAFSKNLSHLLIYTNSRRVWRTRSRGDYWLLDRTSGQLRMLGGDARPATLQFARFSPAGDFIAYVRERNVYVEAVADGAIRKLTETPGEHVVNGTFDWVYEEELGLRDGVRISPDGNRLAFWQLNTEGVRRFPLVNNTDSLYPRVTWIPWPKVGQRNSACRVGVIELASGKTTWMNAPGDPRNHYIARIHWTPNSRELLLEQLNRRQNTNRLLAADVRTGKTRTIHVERDKAWVDVHDELNWLDKGRRFTWISDRDGWRHVWVISADGKQSKLATPGDFDAIRLLHVDEKRQRLYFIASPDEPARRYLYTSTLDGKDVRRVTPERQPGTHSYSISSNGRWAIHTYSAVDTPPVTQLIRLPEHRTVRMLEDNAALKKKWQKIERTPAEFFRANIGKGVELEAWCLKPPHFDAKKKYPLVVYVYGEPAGSTVVDRWGGSSGLWHRMLAERGYVVMSFDNRGTKSPRGRKWRKSVYGKIGVLPPQDQAAAVKAVLKQRPWLDKQRVGIWGWSGGGSSSLHAIFKYPNLYRTAIAIAPVPSQRYYDTIYQERYMGLPKDNVEGFRQGSAINFAHQLKGNLLLIHGTGDDNCHYATTEMLIDTLVRHNRQFQMFAYPNRTHSIKERRNTTKHLREMMTRFLLERLPPTLSTHASVRESL